MYQMKNKIKTFIRLISFTLFMLRLELERNFLSGCKNNRSSDASMVLGIPIWDVKMELLVPQDDFPHTWVLINTILQQ